MNKIIGYFLSAVGLLLIFFAFISMFKVFTGAQDAVQLINQSTINITTQYGPLAMDMSHISRFINLALHALFMFFIAAIGGRVCGAGVNFVKVDTFAEALAKAKIEDIKKL
ncbi:hypothetical protein Dip510_000365 [Elusimicrobium posterum]|uniref:hypothetical protein n=1 Tax=Elusimicrobium posterum TaxID=3116653 RepID=UPI003C77D2ED